MPSTGRRTTPSPTPSARPSRQVGGEVDRVYAIDPGRREAVLDEAKQEAVDRAVAAGAHPATVRIVDFDEVPIPYLPGNATRIRCKAVGDLTLDS